jgi:hypothetical protein
MNSINSTNNFKIIELGDDCGLDKINLGYANPAKDFQNSVSYWPETNVINIGKTIQNHIMILERAINNLRQLSKNIEFSNNENFIGFHTSENDLLISCQTDFIQTLEDINLTIPYYYDENINSNDSNIQK